MSYNPIVGIDAAGAISAVEGEATLALSGAVSMAGAVTHNTTAVNTVASPYAVLGTDFILLVDTTGAVEIDLPASTDGRVLIVKDQFGTGAATNNVTIDPNLTQQIDGAGAGTPLVIDTTRASFTLVGVTGGWAIY